MAVAARLRVLLLRHRRAEALHMARRVLASGRANGEHQWLDHWANVLEAAAHVFEASAARDELSPTLGELSDAYRRKGNLVALARTERRLAELRETAAGAAS